MILGNGKLYICTGAVLHCSQGTNDSSLCATPKQVSLTAHDQANIGDHISMVNVKPFGRCRSLAYPPTAAATAVHHGHLTPMPCVPGTATPWSIVDANSILCGKPALLKPAKLRCIYGGEISILDAGQTLEDTGAETVEILTRTVAISQYYWEGKDGAACDMTSTDGVANNTLCLKTSLNPGDQLMVKIGTKVYPTTVGDNGIAKVGNVDVTEIDWDLPMLPEIKGGSCGGDNSLPRPSQPPVVSSPGNTYKINEVEISVKVDTGWGDPVANPSIRRNCASNLFGKVRRDSKGNPRNHQGFDYYAPVGTAVLCVGDGVVYAVQRNHYAYGNNIVVRHERDGGYVYSFYAHLNDFAPGIQKGKVVRKGEVIAHSGTTGNAQCSSELDEHLHFEARTSPGHQMGLGGKESPNNIVATKFRSANPEANNQSQVKVVKY